MPVLLILTFVVLFALILVAVSTGLKFYEAQRKKQVAEILKTVAGPSVATTTKLLKDLEAPKQSGVHRLLHTFDLSKHMEEQIQQAGLEWKPSQLLGTMAALVPAGLLGGMLVPDVMGTAINCLILAALLPLLPYVYVRRKRKARLGEIEEQLPEALDFLSRSMRAGHAFTISLEMLGGELPDPLGQEFRTLFNEQNLGAPLEMALQNFSRRIPLLDIRFFASSVMLQRQTGGNLAEILTRLAYLIRERFRLKGQVKAASSHGRMTAMVLTIMPVITMLGLMVVSPEYLKGMAKDPDGKWLIVGAIGAQGLGYYFIRKIVNIKV